MDMEMQPPISATVADPTAFPPANTAGLLFPSPLPLTHRRSISDVDLRLPDDISHLGDPFDVPSNTFEKIAAAEGDDLLDPFVNLDFFGAGGIAEDVDGLDRQNGDLEVCDSGGSCSYDGVWEAVRRSHSFDCLNGIPVEERKETIEPKKAMSADKLAELWIVDPKRAKRIMANRKSAARSKERKARYVVELEKKVQSLQREATTLSVQHSLFERDTSSLIVENAELRRELEFMEQQAQLRDGHSSGREQKHQVAYMDIGRLEADGPWLRRKEKKH
ncbi:hypothetical protein V2J09_012563 [Rumex salicifolius]